MATRLFLRSGTETEHLIHLTEGVVAEEAWGERVSVGEARIEASGDHGVILSARAGDADISIGIDLASESRVVVELSADPPPFRLEAEWDATPGERITGLGARHAEPFDQSGRRIRLGADRRYTGPDCPPEMLDVGGVPQGDYVPAPWLLSSAGRAVWSETFGQGLDLDLTGPAHSDLPARRRRAPPPSPHVRPARPPHSFAATCG